MGRFLIGLWKCVLSRFDIACYDVAYTLLFKQTVS